MKKFTVPEMEGFDNLKLWNFLKKAAAEKIDEINTKSWRDEDAKIDYLKGLVEGLEFFPEILSDLMNDAQNLQQPPEEAPPSVGGDY